MNLVDSCGWLEYFADGPNASFFSSAIEKTDRLLVPAICVLEVFKRILQQRSEGEALQAVALMKQGEIMVLDLTVSLQAAQLSHEKKLPLADAVILASAKIRGALIWTQDADFKGLENVKFMPKK